jgi:hypothetical protein
MRNPVKISARQLTILLLIFLPLLYFFPAVIGKVALVQGDGWAQNIGMKTFVTRNFAALESL